MEGRGVEESRFMEFVLEVEGSAVQEFEVE